MVAVIALSLVACGGSSKADYAKSVRGIFNPLDKKLSGLNTQISQQTSAQDKAATITNAQKAISDAATKLEALKPPSDVKAEHDKFVAAVKAFGGDLGPIGDAVRAGDQQGAQQGFAKLQSDGQAVKDAQDALEKKL
jgi:hypothetical protein